MKNLAQELKRKRDAEARLRQTDPNKGIIYSGDGSTGGGGTGYISPSNALTHTTHDALDHSGLTGIIGEAAHDTWDHTGLTGVPLLSSLRQAYVDIDTFVVAHNFGRRPLVQVIGGQGPAYNIGLYGAGEYGGSLDTTVLTPSSITHDTVNQLTVVLSAANTGEVICIG